ncbi:DUF6629 family protein [Flavihumibacter fluvii]|uniref:DUF6629 family protein n=1 Tax=Flavihumibacter fluvii TaxID=2838157 RepID=UPI001BDEABCD|nr:DUF6629 family protein [Flavihumibacter fluvii]ULQ54681.1 hypothetical protein KJS93_10155 [Flavihumibacter fluvii]
MCFSATASFGAGIVLSTIGVASLKKVTQPTQKFFASIPLLFALQQISEGFLWLSLTNPKYAGLQAFTTYTFLFFAQVIWPTLVPLSTWLLEKKSQQKQIQKILLAIGIIVSLYLAYCLLSYPVSASIEGYHIAYQQNYPATLYNYGAVLYILATIAPTLFSSLTRMWWLGAAILVSYIITKIYYTDYFISVWCFFASVISIAVYIVIIELNKPSEDFNLSTEQWPVIH